MARGALSRIANIIRADLDDVLNRMEDPKKLIPYLIREMEEAVEAAVDEVARAVANERGLERRLTQAQGRVDTWQAKAEAAVSAGDEETARQALERRMLEAAAKEDLETARTESRRATEALKQQLAACQAKLQAARTHHRTVVARKAAVRLRQAGRSRPAAISRGAFDDYDRLVDAVAADEAAAEVYERVAGTAGALDAELAKLEQKQKVDEALKELKARMRPTS